MPFDEYFLGKIDFGAESLNFQQANLVNIVEVMAAPLLRGRQDLARKIQDGVQPEDEAMYRQMFENINRKLAIQFGFHHEEESDTNTSDGE